MIFLQSRVPNWTNNYMKNKALSNAFLSSVSEMQLSPGFLLIQAAEFCFLLEASCLCAEHFWKLCLQALDQLRNLAGPTCLPERRYDEP